MIDDDLRKRALRSSVEQLDEELGALWGDIAGLFGEHSHEMRSLYAAKKSCDLVTMQRAVDSLRELVSRDPALMEVDRGLSQLLARTERKFGAGSPQASRIRAARARGDLDEMQQVLADAQRELQAPASTAARPVPSGASGTVVRTGYAKGPRVDPFERGVYLPNARTEDFSQAPKRLPLPEPNRKPVERPPARRANSKTQPSSTPRLKGGARRCSCGNELAMASDYTCYQCKPE